MYVVFLFFLLDLGVSRCSSALPSDLAKVFSFISRTPERSCAGMYFSVGSFHVETISCKITQGEHNTTLRLEIDVRIPEAHKFVGDNETNLRAFHLLRVHQVVLEYSEVKAFENVVHKGWKGQLHAHPEVLKKLSTDKIVVSLRDPDIFDSLLPRYVFTTNSSVEIPRFSFLESTNNDIINVVLLMSTRDISLSSVPVSVRSLMLSPISIPAEVLEEGLFPRMSLHPSQLNHLSTNTTRALWVADTLTCSDTKAPRTLR
eukprot:TRINITY_DN29975_c0_g2_i1.p1 TRINITY_DN29975_c0_g2~~TRINITY_DN29975_c0_g2_i1.p1  ORF type:complete len:270 (+),score=19.60 TRINITY_DN29975_c0_g2_i1:35-811(+)